MRVSVTEPLPVFHVPESPGLLILAGALGLGAVLLVHLAMKWLTARARVKGPSAARIVRGTVAYARGEELAFRIEVDQERIGDGSKGVWVEKKRRTIARPFYIETENGERVRIEPSADTPLFDRLEESRESLSNVRKMIAELSQGERIVAEANGAPEARGGYRDSGRDATLDDSQGLVLTANGWDSPSERKVETWAGAFWRVSFLLFVSFLAATPTWARLGLGELQEALVVDREFDSDSGNLWLELEFEDGTQISAATGAREVPSSVQVRRVLGMPDGLWALGAQESIHGVSLIAVVVLAFLMLSVTLAAGRERPWWERDMLISKA